MNRLLRTFATWRERRARRRPPRESGSVLVLTLIALGAILAGFLYVAVVGSRVNENIRIRTAADSAALAAATVKARALNYESFVLMAQSVLYPLSQVARYITPAQLGNQNPSICAAMMLVKGMETYTDACINHILAAEVNSRREDHMISDFITALSTLASGMDTIGPMWATSVATQTAQHAAYQSTGDSVTLTQIFPTPDGTAACSSLGVEMVPADTPTGKDKRKACNAEAGWELAYVAMSMDTVSGPLDAWAWMAASGNITCADVPTGAKPLCSLIQSYPELLKMSKPSGQAAKDFPTGTLNQFIKKRDDYNTRVKAILPADTPALPQPRLDCGNIGMIPQLASGWAQRTASIAMTLPSKPRDSYAIRYLESLRKKPASVLPTGGPLGMACAEHYSTADIGQESLWTMAWRARLVPCRFSDPARVSLVMDCGGKTGPIGDQFQKELALGIQKEWQF
ncbi:MAG: hypothetical protein U1A78_35105 [Polyangia bacterium]